MAATLLAPAAPRPQPRAIVYKSDAARGVADKDLFVEHKVRNRLRRLVCSARWEYDLYPLLARGVLRPRNDPEAALLRSRLYPPGGRDTLMLRCDYCRCFAPPQTFNRPVLCVRCLEAWRLDDEVLDESQRARTPVRGKCTVCRGRWRDDGDEGYFPAEDRHLVPVQICGVCDSNRMSGVQIARAPSATTCDRKVDDRQIAAHFDGSGYRRSRRAQFRCDDRRTDGGWVDTSQFEDGRIRDWFEPAAGGGDAVLEA